ncbi:anti-sigma factor [Nocardia crassostreae]|uniref:anti-sigma factor n=1 Tax=Nocardia crassostreae TaxID=53428 RepID=UPI00083153C4|nr:anti-sigma factor [Nocardia crassostreae]
MSAAGPDTDLFALAYPYALDAVTDHERADIEQRRERADRGARAAFDATVSAIWVTLAALTVRDARTAPMELEQRVGRALDRSELGRSRVNPGDDGRSESARGSSGSAGHGHREPGSSEPGSARDDRLGRAAEGASGRAGSPGFGLGPLSRLDRLAAALVLAVVLGTLGFLLVHRDSPPPVQPPSAVRIDRQADARTRTVPMTGGGELVVRTSASLSAVAIEFAGVPALPVDRSYQVWLVPLGGTPVSAAVLSAVPERPLTLAFVADDTLALTVEPAGGSPQPTTTPIAALHLT